MKAVFEKGDIVCHRASFLRSISWYTDVPINGKVVDAGDPEMPLVLWCDRDEPCRINAKNILLYEERHKEPA